MEKHDDVIEHNFIVLGPYNGANYGLDFDDGTRNLSITNNIVYGASQRAVRYDLDETGGWVVSLVALRWRVHAYTPWGSIVSCVQTRTRNRVERHP